MRVHIEHRFAADAVDVYVISSLTEAGSAVLEVIPPAQADAPSDHARFSEPAYRWREYAAGDKPPPTFTLPAPVLEAIVAAAADFMPPSAAADAALADARAVRDRLLTVVEAQAAGTIGAAGGAAAAASAAHINRGGTG